MPLDPRIRTFLEQAGLLNLPGRPPRTAEVVLEEMRANDEKAKMAAVKSAATLPVAHVENRTITGPLGEIPIRLYVPEGHGPFPVLLYFHGGGWISGNLDTEDSGCRYFCRESSCLVLSVGYRLPPEHPFPIGLEDCYAAACWLAEQTTLLGGDPARLAVCGASGGGNFAAAIALMCRDREGPPLCFQLLLVPALDFDLTTSSWQSYDGYMICSQEFLLVRNLYIPNIEERIHPYAAPLLAADLHSLPPALIITAECDPVRDGAERYGQRLRSAGVPATTSRYEGMVHGFMGMRTVVPQEAEAALKEASLALRTAFFREIKEIV